DASLMDKRLAWQSPNTVPQPRSEAHQVGWLLSGPLFENVAFFSMAGQVAYEGNDQESLLNLNQKTRELTGVVSDTISRVQSVLSELGIPVVTNAIPSQRARLSHSVSLRLDAMPTATQTMSLRLSTGNQNLGGTGLSQLAFPSASGQRTYK